MSRRDCEKGFKHPKPMKTRPASQVMQQNGRFLPRRAVVKACKVCGEDFLGRVEASACSASCTAILRSISARNRKSKNTSRKDGLETKRRGSPRIGRKKIMNTKPTPPPDSLGSPSGSASSGFRVVARYCYAPLESRDTYPTKEAAKAELKKWKEQAARDGYHMIGRIEKA